MELLYADETGESTKPGTFFFYGGISVQAARATALRSAMRSAMWKAGWRDSSRPLKFDTNEPRPDNIDAQAHAALKKTAVRLAGEYACRLFCAAILNKIAATGSNRQEFQINTVLSNFHDDIVDRDQPGLAILDTFTAKRRLRDIAKDRYSEGLVFPDGNRRHLHALIGIHEGHSGCSHFASIADVVIGSIRYAVNCCGEDKRSMALQLISQLAGLCRPPGGLGKVSNRYFMLNPRTEMVPLNVPEYRRVAKLFDDAGLPLDWKPPPARVVGAIGTPRVAAVRLRHGDHRPARLS